MFRHPCCAAGIWPIACSELNYEPIARSVFKHVQKWQSGPNRFGLAGRIRLHGIDGRGGKDTLR